jgi:hypothetical protein
MEFISENPLEKYKSFKYNGIKVFVDQRDYRSITILKAVAFCRDRDNGSKDHKATEIYYLRGHLNQINFDQVLTGILVADILPPELNEIIPCLTFWNEEGLKCYIMNKTRNESYRDFILKCIACDCQLIIGRYGDRFVTGKTDDRVWIDEGKTNRRIITIHFTTDKNDWP